MAVVRKKQDDKYLKALRELVTSGAGNRQCFDCGQKGPTYVNMTIGSFVCTRCSGVLRGLTPPHRVKSISMATFTQEEIDFLKAHGNELCAKTWLGLWDPKRAIHQDQRELMIDKYERKRYYLEPASPLKSLTNAASLKTINAAASNTSIASTVTTNGSLINHHQHNNNNNNNNSTMNNLNGTSGAASSNGHNSGNSGIHLTPPQSQRTSANGLHKSASVSASAVSRPQHHLQHLNGFPHEAFGSTTNGGGGVLSSALNASIGSTGTLSDTSSCASANGFGADSDFVADFGSANIFDATSAGSVGSPAVSSASSVASSNGYAKIQPIMGAHHNFMNGNGNKAAASTTTENFADFDHAPIYNAAEIAADPRYRNYQFSRKKIIRKKKKSLGDETTPQPPQTATNNSTASSAPQPPPTQSSSATHEKTGEITNMTTNTTTTTTSTSSSSSNLFVNFFPTPPPLPPPPSPQHHHHAKGKSAQAPSQSGGGGGSAGVFLKCDIQRRSSSDLVYSESTSNFNDPFDDFSDMINRREAKTNETRSSAAKFTPLAMAAHATAMAVLGSNYHFNPSNGNPFERQAAGASAAASTASGQWPTLWEESADDLAAAGHGESETTGAGVAAKGSHHNDFGYSLLMNNAATVGGGGAESPATRPSQTQLQLQPGEEPQLELEQRHSSSTMISSAFSTYLKKHIEEKQKQEQHELGECDGFATFPGGSFSNRCPVAPGASAPLPAAVRDPCTSSACALSYPTPSSAAFRPPAPNSSQSLYPNPYSSSYSVTNTNTTSTTNPFCVNPFQATLPANSSVNLNHGPLASPLATPKNANNFFYCSDAYQHQNAVDEYMKKYNASVDTMNYSQLNYFSGFGDQTTTRTTCTRTCTNTTSHMHQQPHVQSAGYGDMFYVFDNHERCSEEMDPYPSQADYEGTNAAPRQQPSCPCSSASSSASATKLNNCVLNACNCTCNNNNQYHHNQQKSRTPRAMGGGSTTSAQMHTTNDGAMPTVDANSNYCDLSFRCCPLPIPNGIHRGQSVGTASASSPSSNNNNNLSSTPAEDRYAALKDLDEQLRESKAVAAAAATIVASNVVDSFGASTTHQQQQQQQHQHQNGMVANPFQQHQQQQHQQSAPAPQLYGQMTVIPNGYHHHQGYFNYNGMGVGGGGGAYPGQTATMGSGPNGCGFGFGAMQQQINATSGGGGMMMATNSAFNNPFAATGSMNSNNPFL